MPDRSVHEDDSYSSDDDDDDDEDGGSLSSRRRKEERYRSPPQKNGRCSDETDSSAPSIADNSADMKLPSPRRARAAVCAWDSAWEAWSSENEEDKKHPMSLRGCENDRTNINFFLKMRSTIALQ